MLDIFGVPVKLVQSTSPVSGKVAASVMEPDGSVHADFFLLDPVGDFVQFDEERLNWLLQRAYKSRGGALSKLHWVNDGVIATANGFRNLFGGQYGGSLGFGQVGGLVAMTSGFFAMAATVLALILKLPFLAIRWVLGLRMKQEMKSERERVLAQVSQFFASLPAP